MISDRSGYIFKVCRVHNLIDLKSVINNGATMIGIHAVILDREEYLKNEIKYKPCLSTESLNIDNRLPVHLYEIESIRIMQREMPKGISQAILFQQPIGVELMKKSCEIYSIPINNTYIQLHHRTTAEYINEIKNKLCKNIIAVVGMYQEDFNSYFWYIHDSLNENIDYILLDLSVHQSDFGNYNKSINKLQKLQEIADKIKGNRIPILLADDTSVEEMHKYIEVLRIKNIFIKGIDMQNSVEIDKSKQKYVTLNDNNTKYQAKVRKSEVLLKDWKRFIEENANKYFNGRDVNEMD